jgi:diguanylate cyclase (GGDEF)-like protein
MRQRRPISLASNIMAVVLIASCVALAAFSMASAILERRHWIAQLDVRLATLADIIGQNSAAAIEFSDKVAASRILEALAKEPHIDSACLYDTSGALFAEYRRTADGVLCSDRLSQPREAQRGFRSTIRAAMHDDEVVGTIYLKSDTNDIQDQVRRLVTISLLLALMSLGIAGFSGTILQAQISKPIARLAQAMHKVTAEESFSAQVEVSGSREIAELAVGFNAMLAELQRRDELAKLADARLQKQARTDALTGLPNRRLFTECLSSALARARRKAQLLGLLYIDLDGFKLVNDSLGHSIGDLLLCEVASRLRSRVRQSDTLARVGGDEFTIILTALKSTEHAGAAAEALLQCLMKPFYVEGHEITVGASIGISIFDDPNQHGADLLRQADSAMYAAKRSGRNRAAYFSDDLSLMARERLTLENQLRGAIERGEIYIDYQPEFDAITGDLLRFEALARWNHPQLGEISPNRFIPVAEESGQIHRLGNYVLEHACREALKWQKLFAAPIQVAVNVSPIQFNSGTIVREIAGILSKTCLRPELLQIELTESVMMGSLQQSTEKLNDLHELGVNLALDDFGTGFSCLSYLPDLPFNAIKLDRSFVKKLSPGSDANQIIRSMVDLAHSMNMRVIAEGVERAKQLELVKELGVDEVQGFLLGRPMQEPSLGLLKCSERPAIADEYVPIPVAGLSN